MTIVKLPTKRSPPGRPLRDAVEEINQTALRHSEQRHLAAAIVEAKRAIAVAPSSKELWNNLGTMFWAARQNDEAMAALDRALNIDPGFYRAFHNKGLVMESLGRYAEAEQLFDKAIAADSDYLNVRWCRSMMRLALGDYQRGWPEYETRIAFNRSIGKNAYPKFPAPYWQGEELAGKRVFCCIEQGIGDTILFSRFLPWLKKQTFPNGKIYLCCAHDIMVLLWEFYLQNIVEFVPEGVPIPQCDYSMVTGSLPFRYGCTLDDLPADPGLIAAQVKTQMRIGPAEVPKPLGPNAFKVGIVWSGNPAQDRNDERSIPLQLLLSFAEHPNIWLYSLQVGEAQKDIARLGADDLVCDLGPQLKERGLTVAATALQQMDLVITCCTSIAHLCGALDLPAWVLLCKNPYWIWLHDRADSPWWPSLRLFRQNKTDDWKSLVAQVRDALIDLVDARRTVGEHHG